MELWSSTVVRSQKAKLPSVAALHRNSLLGARRGQLLQSETESNRSPHQPVQDHHAAPLTAAGRGPHV